MNDGIGSSGKARILAFVIDNLAASALSIAAVALLSSGEPAMSITILCLTYLSYFMVFEALWSRTPGKYFQGLVIRKVNGNRITTKDAALRTLLRVLEANPIMGGLLAGVVIWSSERKQRLGDQLAGTIVVSSKS